MSELEKEVKELRLEAQMERVPVSQSAADLIRYVQDHRLEDPVLNPELLASYPGRFKDSSPCCVTM